MRNRWKGWLLCALALTTAYFVVPDSPESKLVLYNGLGLLAVLTILGSVRRFPAPQRGPWYWFAGGLACFLAGDICYYVLELTSPGGPPFPSIADAFYLAMYPMVIIGLTKLLRSVSSDRDYSSFIDAAVVGIAMFGALWILFVDSVFKTPQHSLPALVTQLAYPVMDVALAAVAARLVVKLHLKHPPFALILLAVTSLAIADTAYGIYNAQGTFRTGLYVDAFWLAFYVLFAAAALHPANLGRGPLAEPSEGRLTARHFVIMFVATMSVRFVDLGWGNERDRVVTIVTSAVLFMLMLARVWGLTRALENSRDRMRYEAKHDALTGLANRTLITERIASALRRQPDQSIAVLFIDIDDFKTVNDSLGHQAGDRLLKEVGERLTRSVPAGDTVARLGGDEFAILIESAVDQNDVISISRRILDCLSEGMDLGSRMVSTSCSIGIAMGIAQDTEVDTLLRNADAAMYLSKRRGKARFEFFQSEMYEEAVERLDLKADLGVAIEQRQLVLHFQPIFDLRTGHVSSTEALIRWRHPNRGMIPPDRFIPLAEENGLIVPIGAWVLHEACAQAARWQAIDGCEDISVTVNLSVLQLHDPSLLHTLTSALRESGLPARHLVLEITESMLASDADRTTSMLEQIKTTGVKLAIDDFGTGYSSLSYLRSFPVDSIKIDRSFISELPRSATAPALIEAIVNLAQALGAYTVAEGIELPEHAAQLRNLGCDHGQGFYYCRPMPATTLTALLQEHTADEVEPLVAWRRSSQRAQERLFDIDLRSGLPDIRHLAPELESLNDRLDVPLMATWPWLERWAEAFTDWTPHLIGVRRAESGHLVGGAMLATRERAEGTAIVAAGNSSSLYTAMQAVDDEVARALAEAVAAFLDDLPGVWSLDLEQLDELDPTVAHLAEVLDHSQVLPELRVPHVLFLADGGNHDALSKNMRRQIRKARNRIAADGLTLTLGFDRHRAISSELIDEVEAVHVSRDRHARRDSDLDRPAERAFWRNVLEGGDGRWEIEIGTMRLDGELAGYVVALLDGDVYRVYDGRMNSGWAKYSPGRLIEAAALERAARDPRFSMLDWMSGVAAEKLLTSNASTGRARLVATSGSRYVQAAKRRRRRETPAPQLASPS